MYRNMHDLVQALILADEEDIAMRLQQLHEIEVINLYSLQTLIFIKFVKR